MSNQLAVLNESSAFKHYQRNFKILPTLIELDWSTANGLALSVEWFIPLWDPQFMPRHWKKFFFIAKVQTGVHETLGQSP